jgi:hypothetical protein
MLLALTLVPRHPVLLYFFHFYSLYRGDLLQQFQTGLQWTLVSLPPPVLQLS